MKRGIDISDNQGIIDHAQVKAAGCEFVVLRSTRGSGQPDHRFIENLTGFLAQGLPVDVYKYTYAVTVDMARQEAQKVMDLLLEQNYICRIWWDVEDSKTVKGIGSDRLTACLHAVRNYIEGQGFLFGIYTGQNVIKEAWFRWEEFCDCKWWIARYPLDNQSQEKTLQIVPPEQLAPEVDMLIDGWQWTSKGHVPGISTVVDLDLFYGDFDATDYYPLPRISNIFEADGLPYTYQDRKRLAAENGLPNYTGTVQENMFLVGLWAQGKLKRERAK